MNNLDRGFRFIGRERLKYIILNMEGEWGCIHLKNYM